MHAMRVGMVGFGLRAGLHRELHSPGRGSVVTHVCDVSERGRADAARALPDAVVTDDLEVLLKAGLDAIVVLTPDFTHREVVLRTLRAGIPTFCEKPLDISVEGADEILRVARETGTRLYVGHNMRHMPVVRTMRDLVASGEIGEVKAVWCRHFVGNGGDYYFKDWHAERQYTNTLLLQKGAHDIDVIHWLAGGSTRRVSGMGGLTVYGDVAARRDNTDRRMWDWFSEDNWPPTEQTDLNPNIDVEDLSMVQMVLDNGVFASYEQCHFTPDYWRNYTVIGTRGRLENFGDEPGGEVRVWTTRHSGGLHAPDRVVPIEDASGGHGGADPALIQEFLRFAREGGVTDTSPVAAREAVATGDLAARSLRSGGGAVDVPALPADLVAYFERGQVEG
jgi:predicted dehydrogenase